jgi:hypothetical protein
MGSQLKSGLLTPNKKGRRYKRMKEGRRKGTGKEAERDTEVYKYPLCLEHGT